jgi:TrmH family RNA methyltransferase
VGTIIRTAVALGYDSILLTDGCADVYNSKVLRATQGAIFNINISDDVNILDNFKNNIYGFALDNSAKEMNEININDNFALVFGNEGSGISEELLSRCVKVYIDINGVESLNVAIAAGIAMHKFK